MKILVVGAGRIARRHLDALEKIEGVELAGIVDPDTRAARDLQSEYECDFIGTNLQEALGSVSVDHVIITAPTGVHHRLATVAIQHGKHVLVEKPITSTVEEAVQLVKDANEAGVKLAAGQTLRFLPMFDWARSFIASGDIGTPIQAIERRLVHRPEVLPWWVDLPDFLVGHWGSHSIDLLCFLLKDVPDEVYCAGRSVHAGYSGVDDFSLLLRMRTGTRFGTHMSFSSRHTTHDIVLIGTTATLEFDCYSRVLVNEKVVMELPQEEMLARGFEAQLRDFLFTPNPSTLISPVADVIPSLCAIDAAASSMKSGTVAAVKSDSWASFQRQ